MMSKHNRKSATMAPPARVVAPARTTEADASEERYLHGGVTLEEATRVRAYHLWERAGRPEGDSVSFWLEAESELTAGQ
jgi:hypothetical protein